MSLTEIIILIYGFVVYRNNFYLFCMKMTILTKIIILVSGFVICCDIFIYLFWFFFVRKPKPKPLSPEEMSFILKRTFADKKPTPEDFAFSPLELTGTEVSNEQIRNNLKKPADWTIKNITAKDRTYAKVTGKDDNLKISFEKGGTFTINIALKKRGYEEYILKGIIKVADFKADASEFSFPVLEHRGSDVLPFFRIERNVKEHGDWNLKDVRIADGFEDFAELTGTGDSGRINIKKGGVFTIDITLQKAGFVDHNLKGRINSLKKTNPSEFSFPVLEVKGAKDTFSMIENNLKKPLGWTIKSITMHNPDSSFALDITLEKQDYEDYVLKNCKIISLPFQKKPKTKKIQDGITKFF